jgi:ribosomal protein S27AE
MKRCFKCGVKKPRTEFYAHPEMADGLLGKCKACTRDDVNANRAAKREQYAAYERQRFKTPTRKEQVKAAQRRRRAQNPVKAKAWYAVTHAIRKGTLVRQPCELCGNPKSQAHHDDYSRPLDVRWLCFRCHREKAHGQTVVAGAA